MLLEDASQLERPGPSLEHGHRGERTVPTLALLPPASGASSPAVSGGSADDRLLLSQSDGAVHDLAGVRIAALDARDAVSFAPIRTCALRGAHVVAVFGEGVRGQTLRARATENRVFLIHVRASRIVVYDPRGVELDSVPAVGAAAAGNESGAGELTINTAEAADKNFAPRTNPFAARRPALYEL